MSNVQVMYFLNGEMVIGEVKEPMDLLEDFGNITVSNPCAIALVPDNGGSDRVGVQLRPWCPFAGTKDLKVSRSHIVYMVEPVVDLLNQYQKLFGTGLVIASPAEVPPAGASIHRIK